MVWSILAADHPAYQRISPAYKLILVPGVLAAGGRVVHATAGCAAEQVEVAYLCIAIAVLLFPDEPGPAGRTLKYMKGIRTSAWNPTARNVNTKQ